MTKHITCTPINRDLTIQERELLRWVLAHGKPGAEPYLPEVDGVRVVGGCECGCASIDFIEMSGGGLEVLSDHRWQDQQGHVFGLFAFAKGGKLAGVEVWSIDGEVTPSQLPDPRVLESL